MTDDLNALLDPLLARLADLIVARLAANGKQDPEPSEPDRLLTVHEAAQRLGVRPRWVYGHARTLPFVVRLPGRGVRFSERGIARYLKRKQGAA
ncbi:MAG: helix-turn-helix transcriptional regulator [Actinomycetota bacterium]